MLHKSRTTVSYHSNASCGKGIEGCLWVKALMGGLDTKQNRLNDNELILETFPSWSTLQYSNSLKGQYNTWDLWYDSCCKCASHHFLSFPALLSPCLHPPKYRFYMLHTCIVSKFSTLLYYVYWFFNVISVCWYSTLCTVDSWTNLTKKFLRIFVE